MGYYSTLRLTPAIKTPLTEDEFRSAWQKANDELVGTYLEGYLEIYNWEFEGKENGYSRFQLSIEADDWTEHYASLKLAYFISSVIAEGEKCILEFLGEDGELWGYYISRNLIKEIEYIKMVDGKPLDESYL